MTRRYIFPILVVIAAVLAACASATPTLAPKPSGGGTSGSNPTAAPPPTGASATRAPSASPVASPDLARNDAQGAVEFVVTPVNLTSPGETLDFDVSMDTHSVDLSWDLAAQSVLTTDTGLEVKGLGWSAGGGHHYESTLTFPAKTADGKSLLDGAKTLTLTIKDAGVPERVFVWELSK